MNLPVRTDVALKTEGEERSFFPTEHHLQDSNILYGILMLDQHPNLKSVTVEDEQGWSYEVIRADAVYVNTYLCQLAYGGPEEGGWYYDTEEPVGFIRLESGNLASHIATFERVKREAEEENKFRPSYHSVASNGVYRVRLEPEVGRYSPSVRPHYEWARSF